LVFVFIIVNMRSFWRTVPPAQLRDVGLVCLADGIVGVSFGASSVARVGSVSGLPWWVPVTLSLLVFAGGSQIAAVGVVLAGGSPLAAVLAGAVLNTRLLPYGFAVADVVGAPESGNTARAADVAGVTDGAGGSRSGDTAGTVRAGRTSGTGGRREGRSAGRWLRGLRRLVGTHLITDESVAFALRQPDPARRRSAFWACGGALFVVWNVSVLLGAALGAAARDTSAFGLDATFPAVMLALALPTLASRSTRVAAGTGAVIAVALTPVLPAGLPLLAALGGLGTRWGGWRGPLGRLGLRGRPSRSEFPGGGGASADKSTAGKNEANEVSVGGGR
jgi:predicted branched-subunit amino acid permease